MFYFKMATQLVQLFCFQALLEIKNNKSNVPGFKNGIKCVIISLWRNQTETTDQEVSSGES